jgi:hypothetical protein
VLKLVKEVKKFDLKKEYSSLYNPSSKKVEILEIPELKFIMIDGVGDPNSLAFQNAVQSLYNLSYTTKFSLKFERGLDYPVMALEGLWWVKEKSGEFFDLNARDRWNWTLMIMQPPFMTEKILQETVDKLRQKGKQVDKFRLENFREGLSAQIMHVGPYSTESRTIEKIRDFIKENSYGINGKHHEIYMGDPRRTAPSRLKTILRQPIKNHRKEN